MSQYEKASLLRELPSIDELLALEPLVSIEKAAGRSTALRIARSSIGIVRRQVLAESVQHTREQLVGELAKVAGDLFTRETFERTTRLINATGVVIHTNLGRSVLSDAAVQAIQNNSGYCTLEYDLISGSRGKRAAGAEALIRELTGAEAAIIVNNCAAAAFLVLRVLARGKDVIISRGELVEIGGDFRVPDVLEESGATLREVGTTNRTKMSDYKKAISDSTGLLMRVHPSNYRVIGFTESATNLQLSTLARETGIPFFEDAGSGALVDLSDFGLGEPTISSSIADGVDLVAFSGDKLLGGVQAGFIVGRRDLIDAIRRHPLYRALRVDKLAYAAIEATLLSYARGKHFADIPTLRMLASKPDAIRERAHGFVGGLSSNVTRRVQFEIVEGESVIGGGSAPDVKPKTWLISVKVGKRSAAEVDAFLRFSDPPVIGRIADGRFLLDLRTVLPSDQPELISAIEALADQEF
ncbi:MAG: L-seryl-tRNA(Sec) selenium transferase [bacterium]|nr:L-seryl-tRNA(Sec) selenium transferase [bacterium]